MNKLEVWVTNQAQRLARRVVVPLFCNPSHPVLVGSAFFVRTASNLYLVSARHVFETMFDEGRAQARGIDLHLFFYIGTSEVRKIEGRLIRSSPAADIAALEFPSGTLISWFDGHARIELGIDILDEVPPPGGAILVSGYPASRARLDSTTRDLNVRPFAFLGRPSRGPSALKLVEGRIDQFAVDFDQKNATVIGSMPLGAPNPKGMSGAPAWSVTGDVNGVMQRHLVGIALEHHRPQRAVVCARINAVAEMLRAADEGLI